MSNSEIMRIIEIEKKLAEYQGEDRVLEAEEVKQEMEKEFEKIQFFKSGFPTLDNLTQGFYTGELICVTGKQKRGKSTFLRTLTKNFAEQGIKSLWFPFDMPLFIFFKMFGENPPIYYLPRRLKEEAMEWLNARIWEAKVKYNIQIVFIDDLSYLVDLVHSRSPSLELGTICRQLNRLAIDRNVVIFFTHHSKRIERNLNPTEEDLRDSALIAGIVNKVITVLRKQDRNGEGTNEGKIILNIDRFSGVLQKSIPIIFKDNFFYEMSPFDYPYPEAEIEKEEIGVGKEMNPSSLF